MDSLRGRSCAQHQELRGGCACLVDVAGARERLVAVQVPQVIGVGGVASAGDIAVHTRDPHRGAGPALRRVDSRGYSFSFQLPLQLLEMTEDLAEEIGLCHHNGVLSGE